MSDPTAARELDAGFRFCAALSAQHGRTYHLAARLLPEPRRRGVHALYGFARLVDDIVDVTAVDDPGAAARGVDDALARLHAGLAGDPGAPDETGLVVRALVDTIDRYAIPVELFEAFARSMRMDVPGTPEHRVRYRSMRELREYTYGSAAVIGLQLLPVFGVTDPERAAPYARALGEAFQLTNFVRDVGEDLDRGRMYLPADLWAAYGVDDEMLLRARGGALPDPRVRRALAHAVALTRAEYRRAHPGLALLPPRIGPAIRTAFVLYSRILDEVEASGFRIDRRAAVPGRTRAAVVATQLLTDACGGLWPHRGRPGTGR
ncbi:MAG: phytoene/squalene synthase family protein [Rhodococcus sp.]|uniref:phytoene/squalene synthase family protein n=1 Tax=Rhodococcus TaxID=1827 RepID=UPI0016A2FC7F|nr:MULTISPECIES: phytoene/squalene synthase family protein [Rhodococcus]NLV80480.1 phytoene/squalene synthase family protein [Rhodococcus sp. (in: high G+C Gram-positive bacteria)]